MAIAIVDTGVANRHSIRNALAFLGCDAELTVEPVRIRNADKLVFPGVGAFEPGMRSLRSRDLIELLHEQVIERRKPILGICLGMQMMAQLSEEGGEHTGLGWLPGRVRRLTPADTTLKIPHIGFNAVTWQQSSRLFAGLPQPVDFYFVHSYALETEPQFVAGAVEYGGPITAAIERDNIMGVQFHPEKSQGAGLQLLQNFVNLK
jgi:imidazole glycerol-phosphate synthase subunit HisH